MDYFIEYHRLLEQEINRWVRSGRHSFVWMGCDLRRAVANKLYYRYATSHEVYDSLRKAGKSESEALSEITGAPVLRPVTLDASAGESGEIGETGQITRNVPMVVAVNKRQFEYLRPLLSAANQPLTCVSLFNLKKDERLKMPFVSFVTWPQIRISSGDFMSEVFPDIANAASVFDLLRSKLKPSAVVCLEGCHTITQVMAIVASGRHLPSVCIQQGWPSFFHMGFKNMPYRYYLTWGDNFNKLWREYNPEVEFVSCGYMYKCLKGRTADAGGITFFLQGPFVLASEAYFKKYLDAIEAVARRFPDQTVYVREHPEYALSREERERLETCRNVVMATSMKLEQLYRRSRVVVAHFSSTIVESSVHRCVPIVYDPTFGSVYNPDICGMGIGMMVKTLDGLLSAIDELLGDKRTGEIKTIRDDRAWIKATGATTLCNIHDFLYNL